MTIARYALQRTVTSIIFLSKQDDRTEATVLGYYCLQDESSSADEIPERDVTYLLSVYLFTTELRHTRQYFLSNAYLLHI